MEHLNISANKFSDDFSSCNHLAFFRISPRLLGVFSGAGSSGLGELSTGDWDWAKWGTSSKLEMRTRVSHYLPVVSIRKKEGQALPLRWMSRNETSIPLHW